MTSKNQNPDSLKPMRRRDEQQWILDWIVKTTGRVQNFVNTTAVSCQPRLRATA
jgi:hypothetical protein